MGKYVALFRGINVSGKNIIPMKELKMVLEQMGLLNVETYIQSGNVVFTAHNTNAITLQQQIEASVLDAFELKIKILVCTRETLLRILQNQPFDITHQDDTKKVYFTFLFEPPANENIAAMRAAVTSNDRFSTSEGMVYVFCDQGYGKTQLSGSFLERKLQVLTTTRNWNTLLKLEQMLNE